MTDYVYDKSGQRLFFVREGTTYGTPYDPESELYNFATDSSLGDQPIPANYPHWRRFDLIPDEADIVLPLIKKLEEYDISDSKHPSAILSGNIEPTDFTIDMIAQGCEFLPLAVGAPALSSHNRAMVQKVTCVADVSGSLNNTYFFLDVINTSVTKHYLVWFDVDSGGSAPSCTGINASNKIEVDISANDTANTVGSAVASAINAKDEVAAANSSGVVTITHDSSYKGAVEQAHDSGVAATGFSFTVTTWGASTYTVTEAVTTDIPSFTIHAEQQNTTTAEDIVYDLYGCVVDSITLDLTWGDGVGKLSVSFKCPLAVKNSNGRNTNNPPRKYIKGFPAMNSLKESASNYLIQEGTTDRTPKNVEKMVLSIGNNVEFKSSNVKRHAIQACATKRNISLQIVGNSHENELFQYYLEAFTNDGSDWYPTSASGLLNSVIKLQRNATYDYIQIAIRNWIPREHNFVFVNVDDAVKSVDITFNDSTPDSNGRIISSFIYQSLIDESIIVG